MSFFGAVGNFFKKIFGFVIKSDPFKALVAQLLPFALAQVAQLATVSNLSSAEKREAAMKAIGAEAKARGLEFADHMLALLVEVAVAKTKGTIGE